MLTLENKSENTVRIVGKVVSTEFGVYRGSDGVNGERAKVLLRTNHNYSGHPDVETSEIYVTFMAKPMTSTGKNNPAYESIQQLKKLKTIQSDGLEEADTICINRGELQESSFYNRMGQLISSYQVRSSFFNMGGGPDVAKFEQDIYILNMIEETDNNGENTGRLIIRGANVKYNGDIDVLDYIVEAPDKVDWITRHWENNSTVRIVGHLRCTTKEVQTVKESENTCSWGEDEESISTSTKTIQELIITSGSNEPKDEDFSYDPIEIKKAFNVRKAKLEQQQLKAQNKSMVSASPAVATPVVKAKPKYDWDE